ncbi:MAG: tetratricopeptide repeat protein, partial [Nitrospirota bacterium]
EETLARNYYRLAREFHPDRHYTSTDPSLKDKLTLIFDRLTGVYNSLREAAERKKAAFAAENSEKTAVRNGSEYFKKGVDAFRSGDFQAAVRAFRAATEAEPANPRYWSHLSLAYSKVKGALDDAEKASLEAIRLEPGNADHLVNLGTIYLRKGMKDKAREQLQNALSLDPGNARAKKMIEKIKG